MVLQVYAGHPVPGADSRISSSKISYRVVEFVAARSINWCKGRKQTLRKLRRY